MGKILPLQETLRPVLPKVRDCKDYQDEEQLLLRIEKILVHGGVEQRFWEKSLELFRQRCHEMGAADQKVLDGASAEIRHLEHARRAQCYNVLKHLVSGNFRRLSKMLAMSPLYCWFCRYEDFEEIQVPGKSTLADYAKWFPQEAMEQVHEQLRRAVAKEEQARPIRRTKQIIAPKH